MTGKDTYSIDNNKVICEAIPFFIRGRRLILLLEGISHPLISIHEKFKAWAHEKNIEASITSQTMSLEWYLTHKFKHLFLNPEESFRIINNMEIDSSTVYHKHEMPMSEVNLALINKDEEELPETYKQYNLKNLTEVVNTSMSEYVVHAPAIQEVARYNNTHYRNDIRAVMTKYLTTNIDYQIKIADNEGV